MPRTAALLPALVSACAALACLVAGYESAPAAGRVKGAAVLVTVTAGRPSELRFVLSSSSQLPWSAKTGSDAITFRVSNRGARPHDFKVCSGRVAGLRRDACTGKATKLLRPGQSASLTVSFKRRGLYEYLSTVPGDAAGGMKGLVGVGVKLPGASSPTTSTSTTTVLTTAPSSLVGNANSGKPVFASAGCGSCHALAAAGASGTAGPSLDATKPTQPVIVQYVTNGSATSGSSMPAYAGTLTPTQIDDLAAYVYLTTHTIN